MLPTSDASFATCFGVLYASAVHIGDLHIPDGHDFAAAVRLPDRVRAAILAGIDVIM